MRGNGTFQFQTTGGFRGGVLAVAGVVYAATHRHQAGEALGSAVITVAVVAGVILAAAAAFTVSRLRGRTGTASRQPVSLLRRNPDALPPREARAIAPPPVVINFGTDLLAVLLDGARQQQQPVRVVAEPAEQQEIQS
jgi:hypothetical protein